MSCKTTTKLIAIAVASAFSAPLYAAEASGLTGEVGAKLFMFDYFKGVGTNSTQFLERYNYQKGIGDDQRGGAYLDLDLHLVKNDGKRTVFELEREGFGAYNHRGSFKANSDAYGLRGYYSDFRSASGGVAFLYSPGQIPSGGVDLSYTAGSQTGFVTQFNNDSPGQTQFSVDRTTYGMGLDLKRGFLGNSASAAIDYDGYQREGNRFATYVLGNGDLTGANAVKRPQRWRGFDAPVDERMNRVTFKLGGAPGGNVLAYEGSIEKFDNQARSFYLGDFNAAISAATGGGSTVVVAEQVRPIQFVPDSTLISNNIRFARNYGRTAVAAGYGLSVLDQDSFSQQQQIEGYNKGKITTNSAYLNVSSNVFSGVGIDGFIKYNDRKNNSAFPVVGLIDPAATEGLDVRINRLKLLTYGLSATFRTSALKSTFTVGWKHEDKDRDLTTSQWGGGVVSIHPLQTLYRDETKSDELYVNWIARPMPGMILRVTPSITTADTGLVTEPEKLAKLKTKLTYTAKDGTAVSGYLNLSDSKNSALSFRDSLAGGAFPGTGVRQDVDKSQQAAGVMLSKPFGEWVTTHASLSWLKDDITALFIRNDARRYDAPTAAINFLGIDKPNYDIDTTVLTLGGDWQVSDPLRLNANYTWSKSKGSVASGYVYNQLNAGNAIDGNINLTVQSLSFGLDYALKNRIKLKGGYVYDYVTDKSYSAITGGQHMLMVGASIGF